MNYASSVTTTNLPNMKAPGLFNFISLAIAAGLSACGGASGGDAEAIATDEFTSLDDPQLADDSIQQDDEFVCAAEIDIAEFFLTEVDRQWSCQITSLAESSGR